MFCYIMGYVSYRDEETHEWKKKEEEILINTDMVSYVRNSEEHEGRMLLYMSSGHLIEAEGSMKEFYDYLDGSDESMRDFV